MIVLDQREVASQSAGSITTQAFSTERFQTVELLVQVTSVTAGSVIVIVETRNSPTSDWLGMENTGNISGADYRQFSVGPSTSSSKPLAYEVRLLSTVTTGPVSIGWGFFAR